MNPKFCFSFCVILLVVPLLLTFLVPLITVQDEPTQQEIRREFIVQMARNAWKQTFPHKFILTSASTLWLMNLKEEFAHAQKWILDQPLNSTQLKNDLLFVVSEHTGSLLSCYALTKDGTFLDKAERIEHALDKLYNSSDSIDSQSIRHYWSNRKLEYEFMGSILQERKFEERLKPIESRVLNDTKDYSRQIIDSFNILYLIVLVKSYIQSNETKFMDRFNRIISSAEQDRLITTTQSGLTYIQNSIDGLTGYSYMTDRDCHLAAILALASMRMRTTVESQSIASKYLNLSIALTETCHLARNRSESRLPQYIILIDRKESSIEQTIKREEVDTSYINSLMAETYFVLYRTTHAQKYRDYAWELAEAIGKSCENGNVNQNPPTSEQCEQSEVFLSRTLKYLYLTFTDDDFLPLDKWVFTAFGQPLPILVQWNLTKSNLSQV